MSPNNSLIKFSKALIFLVLSIFILIACASSGDEEVLPSDSFRAEPNPTGLIESVNRTPIPGNLITTPIVKKLSDKERLGGIPAIIDFAEVVEMKDSPSQYGLHIVGTIPTPCHKLQVEISDPDEDNRITVEAYAFAKAGENCIQIIEEFDVIEPLAVYNPAVNTIWVNGEEILSK